MKVGCCERQFITELMSFMKNIFLIILLQYSINGFAQYPIHEKPFEDVYANYPHILDSVSNTEYVYDDSAILVCTIEWIDTSQFHRRVTHYFGNGNKSDEYVEKNHEYCDTLRRWTRSGLLAYMEINSDTGFLSIDFWNETGTIFQWGTYSHYSDISGSYIIRDSTTFDIYESERCNTRCFVPTGTWFMFHENGVLESEGKYLPQAFTVKYPIVDSAGIAVVVKKTGFDEIILSGILCITFLKDGAWNYYSENGEKIREEYYKGGLLKSTTHF